MSSPRFGPGTGTGNHRAEPESNTSAFSATTTTSYDSYGEESTTRDSTLTDRETRERTPAKLGAVRGGKGSITTTSFDSFSEESSRRDTTLTDRDTSRERTPTRSTTTTTTTTAAAAGVFNGKRVNKESVTTSFDSYSEEGSKRDTTLTDRDTSRERTPQWERTPPPPKPPTKGSAYYNDVKNSSYSSVSVTSRHASKASSSTSDPDRDATVISHKKDVTFRSRDGDTSTDTERHGSYDFRLPGRHHDEDKVEWSCGEAGSWQKLSFLLLVFAFLGHGLAVCTPYWVVGWSGQQWTLYEGVWLSCFRYKGSASWSCSTFDVIRHLFEQPVWYEACQVSAVLSVILLMPALLVASLYSFVVALRGRSEASWLLVIFMSASAFCAFLSMVIFASGYPFHQEFPPGKIHYHASFAMHVISLVLCLLSLVTHLRDFYPHLRVWDIVLCGSQGHPPDQSHSAPKLAQFRLFPKLPSALSSKLRSANNPSNKSRQPHPPSAPPLESIDEVRETTPPPVPPSPIPSPGGGHRRGGIPSPGRGDVRRDVRSSAVGLSSGGDSMSGYDSQV